MLDPGKRWRATAAGKPVHAGVQTFADRPYGDDPNDLWGADVVVLGAPVDARVTGRPGARYGPRAIRAAGFAPGWNLQAELAPLGELGIVDYGDVEIGPGDDAQHVFEAISRRVSHVLAVPAVPLLMGGDHSVSAPAVAACAAGGPLGLIQLDAHADSGATRDDGPPDHASVVRWLIERGHVDGNRTIQLGLRGFWPGPEAFAWQREQGVRSVFMDQLDERAVADVVAEVVAVTAGGAVYLTVDLDVVDPAYAPRVGTPEPGGLSAARALRLVREIAAAVTLAGADVVELIGEGGPGERTAALAERLMREILTGVQLRRSADRRPHGQA